MELHKSININNLAIGYKNNGIEKILFSNFSAKINSGESLAVLGCNGTGKTSFIKCFAGLLPCLEGGFYSDEQIALSKSNVVFVPQRPNIELNFPIKVYDFLDLAKPKNSKIDIIELLKSVNCQELANKTISEISYGQFMKINIIRAILLDRQIMIFDEPFAAMDKNSIEELNNIFNSLKTKGKIIIISLHNENAADNFDHYLTLDGVCARWEQKNPEHFMSCELGHHHH